MELSLDTLDISDPGMMTNNKKKRDILDDILSHEPEDDLPPMGIEGLNRIITQYADLPEEGQDLTEKRKAAKAPAKKKATHYISCKTVQDLAEARDRIRALVPESLKTKISKSRIVNHALSMTLKEFEAKGEESALMKKIVQGRTK